MPEDRSSKPTPGEELARPSSDLALPNLHLSSPVNTHYRWRIAFGLLASGILSVAAFAFSEYLQERGFVNVELARIFLGVCWGALALLVIILVMAFGIQRKLLMIGLGITFVTLPLLGLEIWASRRKPNPQEKSDKREPKADEPPKYETPQKQPKDRIKKPIPPQEVQKPESAREDLHQPQLADPEIQLLERAVEAVRSCYSFQDSSNQRIQEGRERIKQHNSLPNVTDESKHEFSIWVMEGVKRDDMQLYDQVYKQEFIEVRKLLILKGSNTRRVEIDYGNPRDMGVVASICHDLTDLTGAYINREYASGKVSLEDDRRYLSLIPQPFPVNH